MRLANALLCNGAMADPRGLVSMLGAFADHLGGPQFPIRGQLWVVARLELQDEDYDEHHTIAVVVDRDDHTEQVARIDAGAFTQRPPVGEIDPDMPTASNLIIPLPLEFRREGLYRVSLIVDGEPLWSSRLKVSAQLPPM